MKESFKNKLTTMKVRCMEFLNRKRSLFYVCVVLSIYNLVAFHYPFFTYVAENVSQNLGGLWIVLSMAMLMPVLNYLINYLVLYLGRIVGKCIVAFTIVGNAICIYFINTYNVLIDKSMMGNVINTQATESTSFLSWTMLVYVLLLGVLPSVLLIRKSIDYGSAKKTLKNLGLSLLIVIGIIATNYKNVLWIDRHAPVVGSKILPWSYIINSVRYYNHSKKQQQKEIILPDVEEVSESKDICVLIIGESARRQNFSLYDYKERDTNPLMAAAGVTALNARASNTNTIEAVKAILKHTSSRELYEILPNYLSRNGVDVTWRRSNWGTPPINVKKNYSKGDLKKLYPEADSRYDGILFHGLKEEIMASDKDKIFIGIHTYTSHGPEYHSSTPEEFKKFFPESKAVEMANAKYEELINAYDNTIVYTDYLVSSVIEMLKEFPDRRSCVIFISDHGESLGEGGLYMHGVPMAMAPAEQLDIPFIVWTSENSEAKIKDIDLAGHQNIYHSVLKFLGLKTSFYDETKSIFE